MNPAAQLRIHRLLPMRMTAVPTKKQEGERRSIFQPAAAKGAQGEGKQMAASSFKKRLP